MKTIALALALVAVVSAQGPINGGPSIGGAVGTAPAAATAQNAGLGFRGGFGTPRNWGPNVYGPGVNNRWALPPNPFQMQRALAILKHVPGALLRVDLDGEITFTNRFGQEADIIHPLGYDLGELIE